ncbi:AfsR/SARP family transcriptional regulator [Sinosporangium siamense]|nr:BTAD domain-containing putative transcriptional regulator [Sinosporangium siamense]
MRTAAGVVRPASQTVRALLGQLVLAAPEAVSADHLTITVWGGRGPRHLKSTLYLTVHKLRKWLTESAATAEVHSTDSGYRLDLGSGTSDIQRFRDLMRKAETVRSEEAFDLLHEALSLWRGEPLADVCADRVDGALVRRLRGERGSALRRLAQAALSVERYGEAMEAARFLCQEDPLDEDAHALLMEALVNSDRRSTALLEFDAVRRRLAADLGISPGTRLLSVHAWALSSGKGASEGPLAWARAVPRQLPPRSTVLVGRATEFERLRSHFNRWADSGRHPAVAVICGPAGAGKTELGVQWAQTNVDRFPDGQLYIDLKGFSNGAPLTADQALCTLLAALGVPRGGIPEGVDAKAGLYRTLLADRRALVVLDDAANADQVRPLLPGLGSSFTLITSRRRLDRLKALEEVYSMSLGRLPEEDALNLLSLLVENACETSHGHDLRTIADACGHNPLALRTAAAKLSRGVRLMDDATRRASPDHMHDLNSLFFTADENTRLGEAIGRSYFSLPEEARLFFDLLARSAYHDINASAAADLAGLGADHAHRLLETLADLHLVESPGGGRYHLDDLTRSFSRHLSRSLTGDAVSAVGWASGAHSAPLG